MSYFNFINQGSIYPQRQHAKDASTNIPVSIADELFASQSLNVGSPSATGSPSQSSYLVTTPTSTSNTNNNKSITTPESNRQQLAFARTVTKLSGIKNVNRTSSQQNDNNLSSNSVFDFINHSSKAVTLPLDDLVFPSSPRSTDSDQNSSRLLSSSHPKQRTSTLAASSTGSSEECKMVEAQRLFEETNWRRAKAERQHQQDLIQQLYEQRNITLDEIKRVHDSIRSNSTEKQLAMENEDYNKVVSMDKRDAQLTSKRDQLMYDVLESISQQLQAAWKRMAETTQVVGSCASNVAQAYQEYKDERYHQFKKYNLDMKRRHERLAEEIKDERSLIETSKSELAFDLDYWKQAESELDQKMAELVNNKQAQKDELVAMVHETDDEIQTLIKKLEALKQTRTNYVSEIEKLDHSMKQDLSYYQPEVNALKKERLEIESRKKSLEQQSLTLDQKDGVLQQKMEQNNKYEVRERKEFQELDKIILEATEESQYMAEETDSILTVMNICITRRDQVITEQSILLKRLLDDIKNLQALVDQQEQEYSMAQQQMNEIDTQLDFKKLQRKKMDHWKSKSVEHGQYRQAGKWQQEMKQLDATLDDDQRIRSDYEIQLHDLDTSLTTSRKALHRLRTDFSAQERKSVNAVLTILKDSAHTIGQYKGSAAIIVKELDSINSWKSHYEQCKNTPFASPNKT